MPSGSEFDVVFERGALFIGYWVVALDTDVEARFANYAMLVLACSAGEDVSVFSEMEVFRSAGVEGAFYGSSGVKSVYPHTAKKVETKWFYPTSGSAILLYSLHSSSEATIFTPSSDKFTLQSKHLTRGVFRC